MGQKETDHLDFDPPAGHYAQGGFRSSLASVVLGEFRLTGILFHTLGREAALLALPPNTI